MKVLIDADGCPVVDSTLRLCRSHSVPVLILCDTAHRIQREGADTLVFDKGADSVDLALVNRMDKGDIAVTQDYGLATLCLAKGGRALSQNGLVYTADNIDGLLAVRHNNRQRMRRGQRVKGPAKRTREQDDAFAAALARLLAEQA